MKLEKSVEYLLDDSKNNEGGEENIIGLEKK